MKITFICSSLQPGCDGVGDYVRRLACEIIKLGHDVEAIALRDSFITNAEQAIQELDGIELPVLRLPVSANSAERYRKLGIQVKKFNPDLISLQYVGFGYNKRGLPFDILTRLRKTLDKRKLHIMLHELWCGMAVNAGRKEQVLGKLQKFFIKNMIGLLKPEIVFTSIRPYWLHLRQVGIESIIVPIFGNIPTNDNGNQHDWEALVTKSNLSTLILNQDSWLILGFFGTTYNSPGLDQLLLMAVTAAHSEGLKLGILFIGHNRRQDILELAKSYPDVSHWQTGALPAGMINRCMQFVNLGIVTSAVDGIDKSGSALAWMERGIPVLIPPDDKTYKADEMESKGIYQAISPQVILNASYIRNQLAPQSNLKKAAIAYTRYSYQPVY